MYFCQWPFRGNSIGFYNFWRKLAIFHTGHIINRNINLLFSSIVCKICISYKMRRICKKVLEMPGIDPGTSRMLSERSTIWATPPHATRSFLTNINHSRSFNLFIDKLNLNMLTVCSIRFILLLKSMTHKNHKMPFVTHESSLDYPDKLLKNIWIRRNGEWPSAKMFY